MYLCDVHTHSQLSPDSKAPLLDMARAAVAGGLDELCVTDHCDLLDADGDPVTSFDWPAALEQYHAAREAVGDRLTLRLGLELGSTPYDPDTARSILAGAGEELDFVLGSLHNWIGMEGNIDLFFSRYREDPSLGRRVVEHCLDNTWTLVTRYPDCYDSLAHIVYPLRYIPEGDMKPALSDYEGRVRDIFREIARTDHALEVNVYRGKDLDSWPPLLRWFKECGGRLVTAGSDAHKPEDMARGIPQALDMLQVAGFSRVTTFSRRRPELHSL